MDNIVNIEDKRKVWLPCECLCVACSNKWDAVIHRDKHTKLECPECHLMFGAVIHIYPSESYDA